MNLESEYPKIWAARENVITTTNELSVDSLIDACRIEFSTQGDLHQSDLTNHQRAVRVARWLEMSGDPYRAGMIYGTLAGEETESVERCQLAIARTWLADNDVAIYSGDVDKLNPG